MATFNLIGICGRKRHGKDTLGDYLVDNYGYTKIGFADALKEACRCIFGFNDDQLYGDLKEVDDEFWGASPRKVLQYIGTDLFRLKIAEILPQVNDEIWIKVVENKILQNPDKKYVITDVSGWTTQVRPKAKGGPVVGGMPYLVGERGPEIMVPSGSGTIIPNNLILIILIMVTPLGTNGLVIPIIQQTAIAE